MEPFAELIGSLQPNVLMVFGIFLLFGVLGGMVANRIKWMPTITAFMLLGLLIGPHGLGLVTKPVLENSGVLIEIALGLILYKLGNMLHPRAMFGSRKLMLTSLAETGFTFFFVAGTILFLGYNFILAALIGAIAVSSSPAVLVQVSEEMGAKGPVTERVKSIVALNNLFSFLIFSVALPFALAHGSTSKDLFYMVFMPLYRLAGSAMVGVAIAWLAIRIVRMLGERDQHYRFAIVIGAVMLTIGMAGLLHMSPLLAPLVLGVATRWFETSRHNLSRVGLGEGGDLFIIILFVMAGAKIDPAGLLEAGLAALLLVVVRCLGKFAGVFSVARYTGFTPAQSTATAFLLVPMAGMAIGLVTTTIALLPALSAQIATIVFAMIAVFETIGPFTATHAFRMAGEAGKMFVPETPPAQTQAPTPQPTDSQDKPLPKA